MNNKSISKVTKLASLAKSIVLLIVLGIWSLIGKPAYAASKNSRIRDLETRPLEARVISHVRPHVSASVRRSPCKQEQVGRRTLNDEKTGLTLSLSSRGYSISGNSASHKALIVFRKRANYLTNSSVVGLEESDHLINRPFLRAMEISSNDGLALMVPQAANRVRTNRVNSASKLSRDPELAYEHSPCILDGFESLVLRSSRNINPSKFTKLQTDNWERFSENINLEELNIAYERSIKPALQQVDTRFLKRLGLNKGDGLMALDGQVLVNRWSDENQRDGIEIEPTNLAEVEIHYWKKLTDIKSKSLLGQSIVSLLHKSPKYAERLRGRHLLQGHIALHNLESYLDNLSHFNQLNKYSEFKGEIKKAVSELKNNSRSDLFDKVTLNIEMQESGYQSFYRSRESD